LNKFNSWYSYYIPNCSDTIYKEMIVQDKLKIEEETKYKDRDIFFGFNNDFKKFDDFRRGSKKYGVKKVIKLFIFPLYI
jgi:hypothetical protein